MKKLIFCCLVVLMGSCRDKDDTVEPEADYAPEFVGTYETTTLATNTTSKQSWEVVATDKNKLGIIYIKNSEVKVSGTTFDLSQEYNLVNVKATGKDTFEINETVDVKQNNGKALQQRVNGIATKVVNAAGVQQINITLKLTEVSTSIASEEYLEFKKK